MLILSTVERYDILLPEKGGYMPIQLYGGKHVNYQHEYTFIVLYIHIVRAVMLAIHFITFPCMHNVHNHIYISRGSILRQNNIRIVDKIY